MLRVGFGISASRLWVWGLPSASGSCSGAARFGLQAWTLGDLVSGVDVGIVVNGGPQQVASRCS